MAKAQGGKKEDVTRVVREGTTQDWSKVLKGATPEAVAKALLHPRKPLKPNPK